MNASASLKHSRWLVLEDEGDLVDQNEGLSVGDGCGIVSSGLKECRPLVQEGIRHYRSRLVVVSLGIFLAG